MSRVFHVHHLLHQLGKAFFLLPVTLKLTDFLGDLIVLYLVWDILNRLNRLWLLTVKVVSKMAS